MCGERMESTISKSKIVTNMEAIKNIMTDIHNGDSTIIKGYQAIGDYSDNKSPDFFKGGRCSFDIIIEPPTERLDYWSLGVFATRKAIDMLAMACQSNSVAYDDILAMSHRTDRHYHGSEDNFKAETGFLSALVNQSTRRARHGFVLKTTHFPASKEMMDKVFITVQDVLVQAIQEASRLSLYKQRRFMESLS